MFAFIRTLLAAQLAYPLRYWVNERNPNEEAS